MNICEIKMKSTHIPKGKIMPALVVRIVEGDKNQSCRITSLGCHVYGMPRGGLMVFPESNNQSYSVIKIRNSK